MTIDIRREIAELENRFKPEVSDIVVQTMAEISKGVRRSVPRGFWDNKENRIGAVKMYINGIPKRSVDEAIKSLRSFDIKSSVISGLFASHYTCSIRSMIEECYPDKVSLIYKRRSRYQVDYTDIWCCVDVLMSVANKIGKPAEEVGIKDLVEQHDSTMLAHHTLKSIKEHYSIKKETCALCE